MDYDLGSDDENAGDGWNSHKREITALVEDWISSGKLSDEVADKAKEQYDSGRPYDALETILKSRD
jgi:hypothetical protein